MLKRKSGVCVILVVFLFVSIFGSTASATTYDKSYTVYMIGQAHIDSQWTWEYKDTIGYLKSTVSSQLALLNANSD